MPEPVLDQRVRQVLDSGRWKQLNDVWQGRALAQQNDESPSGFDNQIAFRLAIGLHELCGLDLDGTEVGGIIASALRHRRGELGERDKHAGYYDLTARKGVAKAREVLARPHVGEQFAGRESGGDVTQPAERSWPFMFGGDADGSEEHAFVVDDLLFENSVNMLVGKTGTLKTPQVMDMAAHVAQGAPFRGRRTQQGAVVYVAAEGAGAIRKRAAAVYMEHPGLPRDGIVLVPRLVNMVDRTECEAFASFLAREVCSQVEAPVRMLIIDTLSASTPGETDSDDKTVTALLANARLISDIVQCEGFKPATLVVHHNRKNDDSYRGSSSIEGDFDTILTTKRIVDAPLIEDQVFELTIQKNKDGPTDVGWSYRGKLLHVGTTPSGKKNHAPVVDYLDDAEANRARAESHTGGKSVPNGARELVEHFVNIERREGRRQLVPRETLRESGYWAAAKEKGLDTQVPVYGLGLKTLREAFLSINEGYRTDSDGRRTVIDPVRKRFDRRLEAAKKVGLVWTCGDWVWLGSDASDG